jgi:hypothetical protein
MHTIRRQATPHAAHPRLQVSPLPADARHMFRRWHVPTPPAVLFIAEHGAEKAIQIKCMRYWLRRTSHASPPAAAEVAQHRLQLLTSEEESSEAAAARMTSCFERCASGVPLCCCRLQRSIAWVSPLNSCICVFECMVKSLEALQREP